MLCDRNARHLVACLSESGMNPGAEISGLETATQMSAVAYYQYTSGAETWLRLDN